MRRRIASTLTEGRLRNDYWIQDKSLFDISREYDCSRQFICKLMNQYGIPLRSKSRARKVAIKQKKFEFKRRLDGKIIKFKSWKTNERFFKIWASRMAYVVGFICADGCLNEKPQYFSLSQKSPEVLKKIKALMSSDRPICKRENKPKGCIYSLTFADKEMYEDLLKLGLTPAKSLTLKFPDVPARYVRHFIRGCWDGDGSVFLARGTPRASFISGSRHFIEGVVRELYKIGIGRRRGKLIPSNEINPGAFLSEGLVIYVREDNHPSYSIKIGGVKCGRLFHYLYDGVTQASYMRRKYDVFRLASSQGRMSFDL